MAVAWYDRWRGCRIATKNELKAFYDSVPGNTSLNQAIQCLEPLLLIMWKDDILTKFKQMWFDGNTINKSKIESTEYVDVNFMDKLRNL